MAFLYWLFLYLTIASVRLQTTDIATNTTVTSQTNTIATSQDVFASPKTSTNETTLKNASSNVVPKKNDKNDTVGIPSNGTEIKATTPSFSSSIPTITTTTSASTTPATPTPTTTTTNAAAPTEPIIKAFSTTATTKKRKTQITIILSHDVLPNDNKGALAAVNVAMKQVNEHPEILKDYELRAITVHPVYTAGHFFRMFYINIDLPPPKPMFIIGPVDSAIIKDAIPFFAETSILQMNANAFDQTLASTSRYPFLFSACQFDNIFYPATVKLLKHFNWNKIGLFYMEQNRDFLYSQTAFKFEEYASAKGIEFLSVQRLVRIRPSEDKELRQESILATVKKLKASNVRVILLLADHDTLRKFLCLAYKNGMFGEKYMYIIFYGESFDNWVEETHRTFECTKDEMYAINKNVIFQTRLAKAKDDVVTVSSKTVAETWQLIEEKLKELKGSLYRYRERLFYFHDSVWAFSLALDRVLKRTPDYVDRYFWREKNDTHREMLANEMSKVDFQGASGMFKYIRESDRRYRYGDTVVYKVIRKGESSGISLDIGSIGSTRVDINASILSHIIPLDGPKKILNTKTFPVAVIGAIWAFSVCGIIMSIGFLVVNVYYGNVKFMKLSSPNINSLICVGCVLFFIAVISYGLDTNIVSKKTIPTMCNVTVLLMSIGFTLTFGALFSKTWRIYRIFTRSQSLRYVVIKDTHLFSLVLLLVLLDAVIFFIWIGVAPFQLHEQIIDTVENKELDTIDISIVNRCQCEYQTHFIAIIFFYKGMLMLFGLFVAYETRTIKVEAINDSKNIGIAVYNFSFILSLSGIVSYFLYDTEQYIASYAVFAASICEVTTVTLFLVFIPKIIMLSKNYDDPNFRNGRPVLNTNLRSQNGSSKSEAVRSTDGNAKKWTGSETLSSGHYDPKDSVVSTIASNKASLPKEHRNSGMLKGSANNNTDVKLQSFAAH